LELAESWDNVGLLLGDLTSEVRKVMTCLTVTPQSTAEAVVDSAQLVVSHHPILFRPTQRITAENEQGKMLLELARAGVSVYSPHTAFDNTAGGINDILCRRLGLGDVQPLRPGKSAECKLVVFVPDSDLAKVSDALFQAGAGRIGQYRECSYRSSGTGTFFGLESTNPTIGQKGRREEATEWRLEVICPEADVPNAIRAMRQAHSYEEPAFDVYPLQPRVAPFGAGRFGLLPTAESLAVFAARVRLALNAGHIQVIGDRQQSVRKVAVACGAAGEFLSDAVRIGADVFLTGEMRFHDHLAAEAQGLAVVLPGHYATERPGVEELATLLGGAFPELEVWASRREAEPTWNA
jgi:dinuclear metal center YbgI/SA1388 family protein